MGRGLRAAMRRVASMPSTPGMRTSIRTTSGLISRQRDGLRSVAGLGDDLDVRLRFEDRAKAAADERFVVDEQDADHGVASGRRARTT